MVARVKNRTPLHSESLCETCTLAHIERGYGESELLVVCQATSPDHRVKYRIRDCSGYIEKKRKTLYEMGKIAWLLMPREGKRKAGLVAA
jgi:hypothetical protein